MIRLVILGQTNKVFLVIIVRFFVQKRVLVLRIVGTRTICRSKVCYDVTVIVKLYINAVNGAFDVGWLEPILSFQEGIGVSVAYFGTWMGSVSMKVGPRGYETTPRKSQTANEEA